MKKRFLIISIFTIILFFIFPNVVFAADPKLVSILNSAFLKIENWFIKLATPAAAIAIASGIFMKKFSFGDEERMRIGKKLIRTSIFSYAFILIIDLILATIKNLLGQ